MGSSLQKDAEWSQEAGMTHILAEPLPMPPSWILITWCLSRRPTSLALIWSRERKRAYANDLDDPDTLIAIDRRLNRQKGAKDPAECLPPNPAYQTEYVRAWVAVKLKWGLTADLQELVALRKLLGNQVELPLEAPEINCTNIGQSSQLTLPSADLKVVCGSKRYCRQMNSCEEARAFLSQCGLSRLDGDKDGVPCEVLCN